MAFLRNRLLGWAVFLILMPEILGQDTTPQRLPEPAVEAQKQSEKLVRELFKEEYSKKAPADQQALARKLLQQGIDIKDDPPTRYVLFREAREIALKCGDVETTLAAITEMAKCYETDGLALKAKSLAAMVAAAKSPQATSAFTDACLEIVDEAIREERFDVAKSLVSKAETAAKAARDAAQTVEAQKKGKEIEELSKESEKAKEAAKTLESNPADPEASLALGRYLLIRGEVEKALALLAKGSDPLLRAGSEKELAASVDGGKAVEAADAWWEGFGKEKNEILKIALLVRAKENYEKGVAGLSGLTKARVEKRLAEIDGKMAGQKTIASLGPTGGALVGYWRLDGDFANAAGAKGVGKSEGTPSFVDAPGGRGRAVKLDGSGSYVRVPHDPAFDVGTGPFTIAAWILPDTLKQMGIVCKGGYGWWRGWLLDIHPGGAVRLETSLGSAPGNGTVRSEGVVKPGIWSHVVVSVRRGSQGGLTRIYVNGEVVATGDVEGGDLNNREADLVIGSISNRPAFSFRGQIDDVRIYLDALADHQVRALYRGR